MPAPSERSVSSHRQVMLFLAFVASGEIVCFISSNAVTAGKE